MTSYVFIFNQYFQISPNTLLVLEIKNGSYLKFLKFYWILGPKFKYTHTHKRLDPWSEEERK